MNTRNYREWQPVVGRGAGARRRSSAGAAPELDLAVIRVTLPPGDTFASLLGEDYERVHWYQTERERDRAYDNMSRRHGYYRKTDSPTQILEKIVR